MMSDDNHQYHCQHEAVMVANSIMPVPVDYPLADGLPDNFRTDFAKLCALMKNMYLDMAKQPEAYGLVLTDYAMQRGNSQSKEAGLIRKSRNSVNRLPDTLFRLAQCGEIHNKQLIVSLPTFKEVIKKAEGNGVSPVTKYELILLRLVDFGFVISNFTGKPFAKTLESFTVEYPDSPELINTLKIFCDCWKQTRQSQSELKDRSNLSYKGKPILHYYNHMKFDFRFTADQDKIPMQDWIVYELQSQGCSKETIAFHVAFYEHSLQYKTVKYDGNYFYKSKRIVTGLDSLSLKLSNMDNYMDEIAAMPESIKIHFTKNYCNYCDFQGATSKHCKYRLKWTYNNTAHDGCAFICFSFQDYDTTLVPHYWRLLALEYKLPTLGVYAVKGVNNALL
ncbi:MAG: hypothetical protein FWB80_08985 [Defluviitaleaceae bacterium]|nr:hypothetical protein [Defluviitaleaceae bacterium]